MRPSRLLTLLHVLVPVTLVTACASGGGVPRPLPFPGAPVRAEETPETTPAPAPSIAPDVPRVVATALTLRGTPYRNGGSEPSRGFDCSGLVQWVFAQHGTALPRQTTEQFTVGEGVDPSEIRAGDLVFFSTVSRGASHVGIALGDGRFLHAPSSRGVVRVERYEDSAYWSRRFVGARRVAGPPPVVAPSDLAASTQAD
jgi:cell wall-associated NlpC family hydrolase